MENRSFERPIDFARRLGVHKSTVSRAIAAGRLTLIDGRLDVEASLQAWHSNHAGSRPDVAARHAAARPVAPSVATSVLESASSDPAVSFGADPINAGHAVQPGSLAYYTAAKLAAQNDLTRLAMALRSHRRYPLDAIKIEALALGQSLRAGLERLVDLVSPTLVLAATREARLAQIAVEVRHLQRVIRRELPRGLRRLRSAARGAA